MSINVYNCIETLAVTWRGSRAQGRVRKWVGRNSGTFSWQTSVIQCNQAVHSNEFYLGFLILLEQNINKYFTKTT